MMTLKTTLALLWGALFPMQLPKPFRERSCQGKHWKDAFPNSSNDEIREFLIAFTEAFAFSEKEKLKFRPDDTVLQIYRALYPKSWMPDSLEIETLAKDVQAKYGVKFASIWHEGLSLGDLFAKSYRSAQL